MKSLDMKDPNWKPNVNNWLLRHQLIKLSSKSLKTLYYQNSRKKLTCHLSTMYLWSKLLIMPKQNQSRLSRLLSSQNRLQKTSSKIENLTKELPNVELFFSSLFKVYPQFPTCMSTHLIVTWLCSWMLLRHQRKIMYYKRDWSLLPTNSHS